MLSNQGAAATLRIAATRVLNRFKHRPEVKEVTANPETGGRGTVHSFDRCYGTDTSGLIWGEELSTGSKSDRWNTAYYGIAPSVFHAVLAKIGSSVEGATFVDMGSGKGRGVMLATSYPFKAVYGVELSTELNQIAVANLKTYQSAVHSRAPVHLQCMDAADFEFPLEPLVLFFYHPFCRPILQKVLGRLEHSLRERPRPAHIVYINTELRQLLDSAPFLEQISEETLPMSEEDQLDDRVGSTQEECAIYVSTIPFTVR